MKWSTFKTPSYYEYIAKLEAKEEKRKNSKKSQAATQGKVRSRLRRQILDEQEEAWRTAVLELCGYKCQYPKCTIVDKSLHAHHIAPRSQRPDLRYVVSNGAGLCFSHHDYVHLNPRKGEDLGLLSTRSVELARKENTLGQY